MICHRDCLRYCFAAIHIYALLHSICACCSFHIYNNHENIANMDIDIGIHMDIDMSVDSHHDIAIDIDIDIDIEVDIASMLAMYAADNAIDDGSSSGSTDKGNEVLGNSLAAEQHHASLCTQSWLHELKAMSPT